MNTLDREEEEEEEEEEGDYYYYYYYCCVWVGAFLKWATHKYGKS